MNFRIHPLPRADFEPLFALSDAALNARGARRMIADEPGASPCRISLIDAFVGERLILVNHAHLPDVTTPYTAAGAIFVREDATDADLDPGVVPDQLARRLLSVRAYDADWMMTDADVVEGRDLAARLGAWFANDAVARIHIHTARRGCFMAAAARA